MVAAGYNTPQPQGAGPSTTRKLSLKSPPLVYPPLPNPAPIVLPPIATPNIQAPIFLRTPLRHGIDKVVDLSTKEGAKYWERATKSLYDNEKFDVNPEGF